MLRYDEMLVCKYKGVTVMSNEESKKENEVPSHLFSLEARARSYQIMMSRLKGGARSGISDMFGSAEDVFSEHIDVPEIPKLDLSTVELSDQDERQWRAIYLTLLLRSACANMLKTQLKSSRAGEFGPEVARLARQPVPAKTFDAAIKELCCGSVYLLALEQGLMESESESWFGDFIQICMSAVDGMLPGLPVLEIMRSYETAEANKLSQKVASALGRRIGFGEMGDEAWKSLRKLFLCSGITRYQLLTQAVQSPLAAVHADIAALQSASEGQDKNF
jgi:hypothetical protein